MPSPITLLVAHPKELIRAGLRSMLERTGVKIVGEAEDAQTIPSLTKKYKPDVLLIDAALPGADAFELLKTIRKSMPNTQFLVLSAIDNPTYMARAKASGAAGCLILDMTERDLVTAIQNAAAGKDAASHGPFAKIAASLAGRSTAATTEAGLTPRESQVLSHLAYGLSNEEIAQSLAISVETVKEHVGNTLRKLGVNDRTQAAVWAVKSGLI